MRLIIDTDPGVDDAHALMATLAHSDAEVGAIITVVGNVPLARTTANACTILRRRTLSSAVRSPRPWSDLCRSFAMGGSGRRMSRSLRLRVQAGVT